MRFSNKQNHANIPFSREGATFYAATLSVVAANIAVNSAWANKIIDHDEFNSTTTTLAPQNPTTITTDAVNPSPTFIINLLSKPLIQEFEEKFGENSRVDFKPMHTGETIIDHLSNHDEDVPEEVTIQDETYTDDDSTNEEIHHLLLDDDEIDILIDQLNAYDTKIKAIAIADEIDAKENPKINIEDESSSTGFILTMVGLLGAAGAGIAFASGGSNSKPAPAPPSPPPTFTLVDEKMNEGSFKQITLAETDSYGTLTYVAAHDSDDFDITITDNIAFIEAHDDAKDEVTITASNIHNLSTTASFTIIVDNVNPIAREMKDQKMSSGEELTIDLSAKDVWSDSIIFTAATSNEDRLNVSIIDFDPSDHEAKLKMTAHDSLFPGISVTDVKVTATDDDGGSDGYSFKVAIKTPIPHHPDIPTKIQATGTETVDTKGAETTEAKDTPEDKVEDTGSKAAETTEAKVEETTSQATETTKTKDIPEAKVEETTSQATETTKTKDIPEAKVEEATSQATETTKTKDIPEAKVEEATSQATETTKTKDIPEAKVEEATSQATETTKTKDIPEAKVEEATSQATETTKTKDIPEAKVEEATSQATETTKTKDIPEAKESQTGDSKDTTASVVTTKSSHELDAIVVIKRDLQEESANAQTSKQTSTSTDSRSDSIEKQTTTDIDSEDADLF